MSGQKQKTYVKEVQDVIELGYLEEATVLEMYQELAEEFAGGALDQEAEQEWLRNQRKHNLPEWHEMIDYLVQQYDERLSWREVKVEPNRFKICPMAGCYNWFYDVARNGKTITCNRITWKEFDLTNRKWKYYHDKYGNRMSVCAVKLDQYRRAAGAGGYTVEDLLWPKSRRRVQEFSVDLQPDEDNAQGNAILDEMQQAYNDYW